MVVNEYKKLLAETDSLVISSPCPVIVNLISKYYPSLIDNLAPVVSPMKALVEYINKVEVEETDIVLIGPCLAKKGKFQVESNCAVLTFSEVISMITEKKLLQQSNLNNKYINNSGPSRPNDMARRLPLSGGLIKAITKQCDLFPEGYLKVEGADKVFDLLNEIERGELKPAFVDILFCEGCINGVDLNHENYYKKEGAINNFIRKTEGSTDLCRYSYDVVEEINMQTSFVADITRLPQPSEKDICEILHQTGKYNDDDLLNCSACGYNSCREKAIAVSQGLAEVEMCLPYLISEKHSEIKKVQELNSELDILINSSYDGMMMTNSGGKVERVNDAFCKLLGLSQEELLGRGVADMELDRIIYPSVSKLSLLEEREITLIQNTRKGHHLLTTASPIFDKDNNITWIIVNARNLSKLQELGGEDKLSKYIQNGDTQDQGDPVSIISNSAKMQEILKLARKVGKTDSSILIMGESGVGKEVVARYIHEQSLDRKPFIKINCAAIPENLLESELFGYETGAFTGAKCEGKPGMIEQAEGGTLFLDEIGELPLSMQAKLLQVLQEHRVIRIGGTEAINVDFRLITATNKNIKNMIKKNEFREDLYYRLNVVPINIPPLRERPKDIEPLIIYYLYHFNNKSKKKIILKQGAVKMLINYKWPGNVRELANLLERVVVTTEDSKIDREYMENFLESDQRRDKDSIIVNDIIPLQEAVSQVEQRLLLMAREKGKTTYQMAEILGVDQSTIVRKLKKYFD